MSTVADLATQLIAANDARLANQIDRQQHAGIIADLIDNCTANGITWDQLAAAAERIAG